MNNIFDFAPKELVQDAFLCWCFNFYKSNNILERDFSYKLVQEIYNYCGGTKKLNIKKITPLTQQRASKIDVLVEILLIGDKKIYFIFENKLETSHHSNQLIRHIEAMEKEDQSEKKYIYFKIGNLYDEDKELPKEYILIDENRQLTKDELEVIFWRVDWRINKNTKVYTPYICLRYYKTTLDKTEEDKIYFEGMRKIFNELILKYPNLEFGQVHNVGNKEREIGILFFDNKKNIIPKVISEIGKFTKEFLQRVKDEKMYYDFSIYRLCYKI